MYWASALPANPTVPAISAAAVAGGFRGCPFLNAAAEYPDPESPVRRAVDARRAWYHGRLRELLAADGDPAPEVTASLLVALSDGLLEIAYPGFAAQAGSAPLAGVLLAVNSVGSAVGGLAFGALHWKLAPSRQLPRILGLMVLPLALQATIANAGALALVAFFAGLCIAPALTVVTILVSTYAPARYATEAFTWAATCIVSGIGAGNAVGGVLLERFGVSVVFGTSAAIAVLAGACALAITARPRRAA